MCGKDLPECSTHKHPFVLCIISIALRIVQELLQYALWIVHCLTQIALPVVQFIANFALWSVHFSYLCSKKKSYGY